ncbi:cell division protein ZapD [Eikenella sp. Marseille-P7795]|uniref:cell division protein ZapD n=1 Tax=Eikenella sp. Marseille-P7795 TaxID=2866577 RepID=UPI001CE48028|nr:cell division protein ZapD [Eikenella sp. Marseille-P7795]
MSDLITFEHPLSERVRNFLRLEHLFSRFYTTRDQQSAWAHHAALGTLFEIMDCAARAELKLDILQELERQRQQISQSEREQYDATPEQEALYQATQNLQEVQQKFGQHLRENEWLMGVKQRMLVSGGTSPFDLPSYHYWLQLPHEQRLADLNCWIRSLTPTSEAISLLLRILRRNSYSLDCCAVLGNYQNAKLGNNIHMLVVDVAQSCQTLPEISANKYFTHIRFTQATQESPRGKQLEENIPFTLKMCSFDPITDKP